MKYVVLVPDGAADRPLKKLGDKTPLQAANIPSMNFIAKEGIVGLVKTVPEDLEPGSDVATLSLLGYDPKKYYTGRGPLEAASRGIKLSAGEFAFRCNLITAADDKLTDYSAGHISSSEAKDLINFVNEKLGTDEICFYPGVSYRHLLVLKGDFSQIVCAPPHDIVGSSIEDNLPKGEGSNFIKELMLKSKDILSGHPVNLQRKKEGKNVANMIWLWGQGSAPQFPTFREKYKVSGSVISAVDLVKGIGKYAGLEVIKVPGATGYYDTNYEGKADFALKSLGEGDFVFVHVEATDEAGHSGKAEEKIKALEDFDKRLVSRVLEGIKRYKDYKILMLPDHPTPIEVKTHTSEAVPAAIYSSKNACDEVTSFDEVSAKSGSFYIEEGFRLMDFFLKE